MVASVLLHHLAAPQQGVPVANYNHAAFPASILWLFELCCCDSYVQTPKKDHLKVEIS